MDERLFQAAVDGFRAHFGYDPALLVRAPGRVNLLGEHTDYNEGFVLPVAVDRAAWVAASPRPDSTVRLVALDMGTEATFPLDPIPPRQGDWADYPRGVAWALAGAGFSLAGMDAVLTSDVPIGAGLSSSAAVEVAFAWTWKELSGLPLERTELALLCQRAENEYVGVRCGIMDQMASVWGRAGHALLLDCRTLAVETVPIPPGVAIVVADTLVRRELAASEYNRRRQECEEAVQILADYIPGTRALRDVSLEDLDRFGGHLPPTLLRRARHVVRSNIRVLWAVAAFRAGDLAAVGKAMKYSHLSLRDDYQVSSPELDTLAEAAWEVPGCWGARLTGAGFGGCIVALVAEEAVPELARHLEEVYQARFGRRPTVTVCRASDGAQSVKRAT
ncbi:MAG: galactokinase [Anaerolineae bacterium]|nr:galactokinase [Anaerolineae bacterium]MDW8067996.1 galactokinase [Anaerolineae bacterium]